MCETRAIHVMYRCVCFQEVDISISTSAVRRVGAHGLRRPQRNWRTAVPHLCGVVADARWIFKV